MPQKNLAVELLAKLLKGEIKSRSRRNVVEARSFEKMLDEAVRRYQNRAIETAQVIEELIALAKEMRTRDARGETLGLTEDELAFYDALETNDSRRGRPRRRNPARHRPRACGHRQGQRHHRLDGPRERPGPSSGPGQALSPQARLPAGQAGQGHGHSSGAGGGPLGALGGGVSGNWPAGDDISAAGASARTEFERRASRHQRRLERFRPWLFAGCVAGVLAGIAAFLLNQPLIGLLVIVGVLGVAIRVVVPPGSTRSWATGSEGEALTARALSSSRSTASSSSTTAGSQAPRPTSTTSSSARPESRSWRPSRIRAGCGCAATTSTSQDAARPSRPSRKPGGRLSRSISPSPASSTAGGSKVRPILCVHRADLPLFGASPAGVSIVDGHGLVKLLREAPPRLSAEDIRELTRIANDRLQPAAARVPPRSDSTVALPAAASSLPADDEQFMPPVRREQHRAAREPRARASDQRQYWTSDGLAPGQAPPTIPPDEPKQG